MKIVANRTKIIAGCSIPFYVFVANPIVEEDNRVQLRRQYVCLK